MLWVEQVDSEDKNRDGDEDEKDENEDMNEEEVENWSKDVYEKISGGCEVGQRTGYTFR
jgi:hypothetical protein